MNTPTAGFAPESDIESAYAWRRLAACVALSTIGGVGIWSVVVVLPAVQAEFGITRAEASLPYTLATIGFAIGGVVMGRVVDRIGVMTPVMVSAAGLFLGYIAAGLSTSLWQFALAYGVLIGLVGTSATFSPLMADISQWFTRNRGTAVAISASGNYFAGTFWPPVVQRLSEAYGWRPTHIGIGIFCIAAMIPLALILRKRAPAHGSVAASGPLYDPRRSLGIAPNTLQLLLCIAAVGCCVAMSMPQVHIVAYCGDLGYGVARGAEMLAVMLGFGIFSRIGSGFIADRIGGVRTLLIGAVMQGVALVLYLMFTGLPSLYVISAIFGLFQGGIVPSYAIIVREYFPPNEAGFRVGLAISSTLVGMAFGGWISGKIFDLTGSYFAAFANGVAFNFVVVGVALWMLLRTSRRAAAAA